MQLLLIHKQILQCLIDDGEQTPSQIERKTGFNSVSISVAIDELRAECFVANTGVESLDYVSPLFCITQHGRDYYIGLASTEFIAASTEYLNASPSLPVGPAPLTHDPDDPPANWLDAATTDDLQRLGVQPSHPLQQVFDLAIHQLTKGKGERHGGEAKPFLDQQWVSLADDYGVGGLFFQANKKLREAQGKDGEARQRELLGALNYLAMGVLYEMAQSPTDQANG